MTYCGRWYRWLWLGRGCARKPQRRATAPVAPVNGPLRRPGFHIIGEGHRDNGRLRRGGKHVRQGALIADIVDDLERKIIGRLGLQVSYLEKLQRTRRAGDRYWAQGCGKAKLLSSIGIVA